MLEDVSEAETILEDYHLLLFQNLRQSDTSKQVKSCTKHGRPDWS